MKRDNHRTSKLIGYRINVFINFKDLENIPKTSSDTEILCKDDIMISIETFFLKKNWTYNFTINCKEITRTRTSDTFEIQFFIIYINLIIWISNQTKKNVKKNCWPSFFILVTVVHSLQFIYSWKIHIFTIFVCFFLFIFYSKWASFESIKRCACGVWWNIQIRDLSAICTTNCSIDVFQLNLILMNIYETRKIHRQKLKL